LDAIPLPSSITTGSLYASFIIRVKSNVSSNFRHSPASFLVDTTSDANAGAALSVQSGTSGIPAPASFWMRTDPVIVGVTNFSPGKASSDGIGPAAAGPSAGWQHSDSDFIESNQFGDTDGQLAPNFDDPLTYQTYFVVMKYEFDAISFGGQSDAVSLWINPGTGTLGSATGEADASQNPTGNLGSYYAAIDAFGTSTPDSAAINSFGLFGHRQNVLSTIAVDFDELRIGLTWADVTPVAAAQPGDFNGDGKVDAADYVALTKTGGNYNDFFQNFGEGTLGGAGSGQVPEPSAFLLLAIGVSSIFFTRPWRAE
jgi:hypothetical protein